MPAARWDLVRTASARHRLHCHSPPKYMSLAYTRCQLSRGRPTWVTPRCLHLMDATGFEPGTMRFLSTLAPRHRSSVSRPAQHSLPQPNLAKGYHSLISSSKTILLRLRDHFGSYPSPTWSRLKRGPNNATVVKVATRCLPWLVWRLLPLKGRVSAVQRMPRVIIQWHTTETCGPRVESADAAACARWAARNCPPK
jgi:hypothetical protein